MPEEIVNKHGRKVYQGRLRKNYASYDEFCAFSQTYKLHLRLGYISPMTCWKANPTIQWSTHPEDFVKVKPINKCQKKNP